MSTTNLRHRNQRLLIGLGLVVAGMTGLAFASVPLYRLFCQVTGYGGTTQVADGLDGIPVLDRTMTVRFNADVQRDLPWWFAPEIPKVEVRLGEPALVAYQARNLADHPVIGTAVYNVAPAQAGVYFNKIECFCFTDQRLLPGQVIDMPVYFFVDPALADDPALDEVGTITLSYTFFRSATEDQAEPDAASVVPAAGARGATRS